MWWQKPRSTRLFFVMVSTFLGLFLLYPSGFCPLWAASPAGLEETLVQIFTARARALLGGRQEEVARFYDLESLYGRWALEHERRRVDYLAAWTKARGVKLLAAEARIGIRAVDPRPSGVWVFLVQHLRITYGYTTINNPKIGGWFGIGTRHCLELTKKGDKWYLRRDWFIDPLEEDAVVDEVRPAEGVKVYTPLRREKPPSSPGGYDRLAAVAYADKYAGLARGIDGRYNPAYRDYTYAGGDCTNFVSQVLADLTAGKMKQDSVWGYFRPPAGQPGGTRAWTQAPALVNYLLWRGRARLIGRGTYPALTRPEPGFPQGAIDRLEEGDLIGYEEKGRLEHLAVMVGRDACGYPLVNSHTADRYHVPWDLGWDKNTVFWLLQIME